MLLRLLLQDGIDHALCLVLHIRLDIGIGLLDIKRHVEGVARRLRDGDAVVQGKTGGDRPEGHDDAPRAVASDLAGLGAFGEVGSVDELVPEADSDNKGDKSRRELARALHGEDGSHHGAPPSRGCELRGDDGREGIVAADTNAHYHPPEDEHAGDADGPAGAGKGLDERRKDNNGELNTVHLSTTYLVGEPAKEELPDDGTARGSRLQSRVNAGGQGAGVAAEVGVEGRRSLPEDHAKHGGDEVDGEDIVGVSKEADARDDDSADVVPTEEKQDMLD